MRLATSPEPRLPSASDHIWKMVVSAADKSNEFQDCTSIFVVKNALCFVGRGKVFCRSNVMKNVSLEVSAIFMRFLVFELQMPYPLCAYLHPRPNKKQHKYQISEFRIPD